MHKHFQSTSCVTFQEYFFTNKKKSIIDDDDDDAV